MGSNPVVFAAIGSNPLVGDHIFGRLVTRRMEIQIFLQIWRMNHILDEGFRGSASYIDNSLT